MKQSKRVLSVLMALVMLISAIPMSVYAAYTPYTSAGGYDVLDKPYVTPAQAASMLCDIIDKALYEANITYTLNIYVGSKTVNLTSIDNATTSITDLWNWTWIDIAFGILNFADVEDMNMNWIENCPLRTSSGQTDLDVVLALCRFAKDNYERIGKIIDDTFDYGFITTVATLPDTVHQIPQTLKASVLKSLNNNTDPPAGTTVDQLVNKMVASLVVGTLNADTGKYEGGLLPSMAGKTDINTTSVYTFITDAINAALGDVLVPMLSKLILSLAGVTFDEDHPGGDDSNLGSLSMIIDTVTGIVNVPYTPEDLLTPLSKMTAALKFMLIGGGLVEYFYLDNTGLHISQKLIETVDGLIRLALTMLPNLGFLPVSTVFKTEEEIGLMTTPECYAYLARLLLNQLVAFADIPDTAESVRAVLTYLLVGLAKDVLPEMDFESMISAGTLNPNTDGVFIVGAALMRYYLNGILPIDIPTGLNFEQTIDYVVTWFLNKYSGLFNMSSISPSDTVWQKLDKIIFGIIPTNWLPAQFTGSRYLVMDWLIGNILDFNYVGLASIVQRNPASELNTNIVTVLLNTVSRFLYGTFQSHTIVPLNLPNLDSIFTKTNLRGIVQKLCQYLSDYAPSLLGTLFPLATQLIGVWSNETYIRKAPVGSPLVSISALQALLNSYTPANLNENIKYYQAGYHFFGPEDYAELRMYNNYKAAKDEVQGLLDAYKADPASLDLQKNTDAAYRVTYYYNHLVKRGSACVTQLTREIEKAYYNSDLVASKYTAASWVDYQTAYNFAMSVRSDAILHPTTVQQSKITMARHMLFQSIKNLAPFVPYADYTQLDFYIEQAQKRLDTLDASQFTAESVQALRDALNAAKTIDRNIPGENQDSVTAVADALYNAMYNLDYILDPGISAIPNSATDIYGNPITPIINTARRFITGLSIGGLLGSVFQEVGGATTKITKTNYGYGTGTQVKIMYGGVTIASYTVVVYGDLNGDGNIDDCDSGMIIDQMNKYYTWTLSSGKLDAADVNKDNNIDAIDADIITNCLNYKMYIDQVEGKGKIAY